MANNSNEHTPVDRKDSALNTNATAPDSINSDVGKTGAPDDQLNEGDRPLPEELTGRAASTDEDLTSLFSNGTAQHLEDGFRSGNGDDPETDVELSDDESQIDR